MLDLNLLLIVWCLSWPWTCDSGTRYACWR